MKFSRFRGKDVWKMAWKMALFAVVLAALAGVGVYFGGKYAVPKVTAFLEEMKENRAKNNASGEVSGLDMADMQDGEGSTEDSQDAEGGEEGSQDAEGGEEGSQDAEGEEGSQDAGDGGEGAQDAGDGEGSPQPEEGEGGANGVGDAAIHRYQYVVEDCSWPEAAERCREKGGYLAVINSQEEYDYIIQELEANHLEKTMFFLGASRGEGSEYYWMDTDGEFTGEPLNGAGQWMQGEPSFQDGEIEENVMAMFRYEEEGCWVWNDIPSNILESFSYYSGKIGYICEFNE